MKRKGIRVSEKGRGGGEGNAMPEDRKVEGVRVERIKPRNFREGERSPAMMRYSRFFPVHASTAQWGLSVTGVGVTEIPRQSAFSLFGLPDLYQFTWARGRTLAEYGFLYVAGGEGLFESMPTGVRKVGAGDAMVLFPGVWHRYRPDRESGWKIYWVNGNGEQLHGLVHQGFFSPEEPLVHVEVGPKVQASYERLLKMAEDESADNPLLLSAGMLEIIARFSSRPRSPVVPGSAMGEALKSRDSLVAKAVCFIWNAPSRSLTVECVASASGLARRSLERRFQNALGHTIYEEIVRCRVERAKRFLQDTSMPVKQVAMKAGFPNTDRMGKVFQRMVGVSPMAYRRCLDAS